MFLIGMLFMHMYYKCTSETQFFSLSNFTLGKKKPLMGVLKREPISRQTKNPFKNQLQDRNLVIMGKFVKWHAAKAKKSDPPLVC